MSTDTPTPIVIDPSLVSAAVSQAVVSAIGSMQFYDLQRAIQGEVAKLVADPEFVAAVMAGARQALAATRPEIVARVTTVLVKAHTDAIEAQVLNLATDLRAVQYAPDYAMTEARKRARAEVVATDNDKSRAWAVANGWAPPVESAESVSADPADF